MRKKIGELNAVNNQLMKQNQAINRELERNKLANQTLLLENKEKNQVAEKLREAVRNNQPMKDTAQTDAIIEDLRKELKRDKAQIKAVNDRNQQLSKDLESANQFREELKDKDQGRQMTELINTNEELARRLQKLSRDLTEYKEKVGDLNRQKVDYETEIRILKEKAGLPEDWGMDYRQTRAREKSELEYLREHVKMLETTNIVLEGKNKELDTKLMNQYQSYSGKGAKFNLNAQQMMLVDEYAENLRKGIEDKPYKDKSQFYEKEIADLKKQLDLFKNMNVKKDFNNVINKLDELMNQNSGSSSTALNATSLDKISHTLKDQIEHLYNKLSMKLDDNLNRSMDTINNTSVVYNQGGALGNTGAQAQGVDSYGGQGQGQGHRQGYGPTGLGGDQARMNEIARDSVVPHIALDFENKTDGYFMAKINEFVPINSLAALPKQNKEIKEQALHALLIDSMDTGIRLRENEKLSNERVAEVTRNLKEGMMVKDMLIRDLFETKNNLLRKDDEIKLLNAQVEDSRAQFDRQVDKMKGRLDELYSEAGESSQEAKYLELLKRVSILEANKIKDQRLLNVLKDKSELYYKNYTEVLKDIEEREKDFVKKISYLKEWKANANVTLQQLYARLKFSVPTDTYHRVQNDLQRWKSRYTDLISQYTTEQKNLMVMREMQDRLDYNGERNNKIINHVFEIKGELTVLSTRLALNDPSYRFELACMYKIVDVLKKNEVTLTDLFGQYEHSRPYLGAKDFKEILGRYQIDLGYEDVELLFKILTDEREKASVSSLKARFRKYGLSDLDGYERVLLKIKSKFDKKKTTLKQLFAEIDRDRSGSISKEEFRKFLLTLDSEMNNKIVDDILRYMNITMLASIDYNDFITQLSMLNIEYASAFESFSLSDWVAEQMQNIYSFLNKHASFEEAVRASCNDTGTMTVDLLHENLLKYGKNYNKAELRYLFACLNPRGEESEAIAVHAFIESSEHIRVLYKNKQSLGTLNQRSLFAVNLESNPLYKAQIDTARLAEEVNQYQEMLNIAECKVTESQNLAAKMEKLHKDKVASVTKLHEENRDLQLKLENYEKQLAGCISMQESKKLLSSNDYLTREVTRLRSECHHNKDMVFVLSRQVETSSKVKDANAQQLEILNSILSNASSEHDGKIELSKIAHQLQIHKLQSIYYYKKYVQTMQESDLVKLAHMDLEKTLDTQNKHELDTNMRFTQLTNEYDELRNAHNLITRGYLTIEKYDELKDLYSTVERECKSASEERMSLKDNFSQIKVKFEIAQEKIRHQNDALTTLKNNSPEDVKRYAELGQKLSETKLKVMQAERSESNMREKVEYMDKVYQELLKRIRTLEEENVKLEAKGFETEEELRRKGDELNRSLQELTYAPLGLNNTLQQTHSQLGLGGLGETQPMQNTWQSRGELNQTLNLNMTAQPHGGNATALGFNRVMLIQNKYVELEAANRALKEQNTTQEVELRNLANLLEKYQEVEGAKDTYANPALRSELDRLNLDFKESVEQELADKTRKANKTIGSLKEIIDQKNSELESKEHEGTHLRKKVEEIEIFYSEKVRALQVQLDEKERGYLRSLKDLGKVELDNKPNPRNSTQDLKAFQDMMEVKDKELTDLQIRNNSYKASMKDMQLSLDQLRSLNEKQARELEAEKRKNTSDLYKNQLRKMEKDIKKKDKDIEEYRKLVEQLKNKMYEFVGSNANPQPGGRSGLTSNKESFVQQEQLGRTGQESPLQKNNSQGALNARTVSNVGYGVEESIVDKTKYNNVYEMKRKVDTISKQVSNYRDKDAATGKELAQLNSELVKERELHNSAAAKFQTLVSKHQALNADFVSLKNKCAILEKTVDNKGDKYVERVKDVIEKVRRCETYLSEVRNLAHFEFYSQEEFCALLRGQVDEAELKTLFEYAKEKAQSKVSNYGIIYCVENYLVDVAYNFDLLNFIAQELSTDKRAYEAFALLLNKDTRAVSDYENALQRLDEKDSGSAVGDTPSDFKPEITDLLRLKDKHSDKWNSDSLKVIVMFAFKYRFVAQLKSGALNVAKALKLDHTKNVDGEVYVPESVSVHVNNAAQALKALLNVYSVNALVSANAGAVLYLPQFDALCRRIHNYFAHKKIDLNASLTKPSYKLPALVTLLDQYGLKLDSAERNTFKELCMALEGLETKNLNEDAFKVAKSKFIEYVARYKKVTSDPGYKPQSKAKDAKLTGSGQDPLDSDEKTELTAKLSKEKVKNIELRDKLSGANNKATALDKAVKEQEGALEKLKEEKQKLLKENVALSEKARKTQKSEAIPFKKLEELQELKSGLHKAEQLVAQRDKQLAVAQEKLTELEKEVARKCKAYDALDSTHNELKADYMLFTQEGKKENLSFFGEKNKFISNLNHLELESRNLVLENERLLKEAHTLRRDQIDLKLGKEQAEVKLKRVEERLRELEEYRALVAKLRQRGEVKPAHEKTKEETTLDNIDIAAVYLSGNKEQEQNAFVYELKKQMEEVLSKNIKLEADNEKLRKLRNQRDELANKKAECEKLREDYELLQKRFDTNSELLESLQYMKKLWEATEKDSKKYMQVSRNLEDENASLKIRMSKVDKENKELKDYLRIKER